MHLASAAFADGQTLPMEFTCDGAGRSPPLQWTDPPGGTRSFALVMDDPDVPHGTFHHWGVYDLPPDGRQLAAGAAEAGAGAPAQTSNDFGEAGYGPPCPPRGDAPHHYRFRLMALDVGELGSPAQVKDVLDSSEGHVLARAQLVALYGRG
jgi:Raf kinase inhibitor-like YbhB/YbcL family protein